MQRRTAIVSTVATLGLAATAATPAAHGQGVEYLPDEALVSLTGTVASAGDERFVLDYGDDLITVEMDDFDTLNDAAFIDAGDRVTVDGRIDDGFYESRTIEASRVFSFDRSTTYYASPIDEEGDTFTHVAFEQPVDPQSYPEGTWVSVSGIVDGVSDREFRLDLGPNTVRIDTEDMSYNPMDNVGYQEIDVGDTITVVGEINDDLFEKREITAERIYSIGS